MIDPDWSSVTCLRLAGSAYEVYAEGPTVEVDWPIAVRLDAGVLAAPPAS